MIQNLQVTANIDLTNVASNYSLPQDREIVVGVVAATNEGKIQNTKVSTSSGTVNIGTLQTVGSHNQALYAGNRALGRGYILNGNSIIRVP